MTKNYSEIISYAHHELAAGLFPDSILRGGDDADRPEGGESCMAGEGTWQNHTMIMRTSVHSGMFLLLAYHDKN